MRRPRYLVARLMDFDECCKDTDPDCDSVTACEEDCQSSSQQPCEDEGVGVAFAPAGFMRRTRLSNHTVRLEKKIAELEAILEDSELGQRIKREAEAKQLEKKIQTLLDRQKEVLKDLGDPGSED